MSLISQVPLVSSAEARRRLHFFARSLFDPRLPHSGGALRAPGMSVLIPHFRENVLIPKSELLGAAEAEKPPDSPGGGKSGKSAELMGFLISYFHDEWANFIARTTAGGPEPGEFSAVVQSAEANGLDLEGACSQFSTLQVSGYIHTSADGHQHGQ